MLALVVFLGLATTFTIILLKVNHIGGKSSRWSGPGTSFDFEQSGFNESYRDHWSDGDNDSCDCDDGGDD
jgi:hypothetical protein